MCLCACSNRFCVRTHIASQLFQYNIASIQMQSSIIIFSDITYAVSQYKHIYYIVYVMSVKLYSLYTRVCVCLCAVCLRSESKTAMSNHQMKFMRFLFAVIQWSTGRSDLNENRKRPLKIELFANKFFILLRNQHEDKNKIDNLNNNVMSSNISLGFFQNAA